MAKKRPERALPLFRRHSYLYSRTDFERIAMLAQRPRKGWRQRHGGGATLPYLREFAEDELAANLPGYENLPEDIIKIDGRPPDTLNPDGILVVPKEVDGYRPGNITRTCRIRHQDGIANSILCADFLVPTDTEIWYEVMFYLTGNNRGYHYSSLCDTQDRVNDTYDTFVLDQYWRYLYHTMKVDGSGTNTSTSGTGFSSISAGQWWVLQAKLDPVNELLWGRIFRRSNFMWSNSYAGWRSWPFPRADWPASPKLTYIFGGMNPAGGGYGDYHLGRFYVGLPEHEWPTSESQVVINFDEEQVDSKPQNVTVPAGSGEWAVKAIPNDSNGYKPSGFSNAIRSPTTSPTRFYFPLNRATDGALRVEILAYCSYGGLAAALLKGGMMTNAAWPPEKRIRVGYGRNVVGSFEWISEASMGYNITGTTGETEFGQLSWTSTSPYRPDFNRWVCYEFEYDPQYSESYGYLGRTQLGVRYAQNGTVYPVQIGVVYTDSAWTNVALPYFYFEFESVDTESAYVYVAQIVVGGDGHNYPLGAKL